MEATGQASEMERTLRERFGLEAFRPGQGEVIEAVLARRDVLCVMPTGGGKSLCYQLPALLTTGVTLVVSPLIALMKDQVDGLQARGIRATCLNSAIDPSELRARLTEVELGRYDLVYVAPERFRSGRFVEAMGRIKPALLAVDEAHCISEWGHDFRPDYARLGQARRALGMPPCVALTATATDLVRRDIAEQLDLHDPALFVTGFDRPNLTYRVIEARRDLDKLAALCDVLRRNPGSAIVYASSRKRCEDVARHLEHELRRPVVVYHAGLDRDDRNGAQERFMSGEAAVVVATNAFGMGVDKADVRSVIHYNMPGTLEAYYQEAGRAGRDGLPAECVLLYAAGDRYLQEMFIENEYPPPEAVYRVYDFLRAQDADPIELTQQEIKESLNLDLNESAVGTALKILEGAGALERLRPRENMAIVRINAEPEEPSLVDRLGPTATAQRAVLMGLEALVRGRLGEPVYFHPDDFAASIGLDRTALSRTLRVLIHEAKLPIDYIPPFRGNAVRVFDRERKARSLKIDFAALNGRKQQEYDKLERMIRYAQSGDCRRAAILRYFGDRGAASCGRCDVCERRGVAAIAPAGTPIDTPASREVVLKALSGVARAKGRFGKTTVAQMLAGSGSERMDRWGLRQLSTFGILSDFTQAELSTLLDALTDAGLIESRDVDRFRPIVALSDAGWAIVRNPDREPPSLVLPEDLAAKVRLGGLRKLGPRAGQVPYEGPAGDPDSPVPDAGSHDDDDGGLGGHPLFERLRGLRTGWAREAKIPPYCVLLNETLEAIVRERPGSPAELARIKGLGPAKLERYGAALLEAVRAFSGEGPRASEAPPPRRVAGAEILPVAGTSAHLAVDGHTSDPGRSTSPDASSTSAPGSTRTLSHDREADNSTATVATEEWTCRLLDRGFSAAEAAAIRGLEPVEIARHAARRAVEGRSVRLDAFLSPEALGRWDAHNREHGDAPPPDAEPALWLLYRACRGTV